MRKSSRVAVLALLLWPVAVSAQRFEGAHVLLAHVLVGGGMAIPVGANVDGLRTGYQVQGAVEVGRPESVVEFRFEGLFDRLGSTYNPNVCLAVMVGPCGSAHFRERRVAGTLDVVLRSPWRSGMVVPYLIGGGGAYWHELSEPGTPGASSYWNLGVNVGAGVRVRPLHVFVEVRDHFVRGAMDCVPITIGLRF